jgi:hypothetical protein
MRKNLTSVTFLPWLAQESLTLARSTSTGGDPFPYLWGVATDALDWLRYAPQEEREAALQAVKQCLEADMVGEVSIPTEPHEADCFVTLLRWILDPPQVL